MAIHSSILGWRILMDRGAWRATVSKVTKSQTWLKRLSMHAHVCIYIHIYIFYFWLCWIFSAAQGRLFLYCGEQGLLFIAVWLLLLWSTGFRAHRLQQLWHTGLVALWLVGSSRIKDRTRVSYMGKWILYHWATREAPADCSFKNCLDNLVICLNVLKGLKWK